MSFTVYHLNRNLDVIQLTKANVQLDDTESLIYHDDKKHIIHSGEHSINDIHYQISMSSST